MVDKNSIQVVTERHGRVEGGADGVLRALVDGQGLETVRVDPGPDPQVLVFNKFLLDPTESELGITVVVLEAVPTHHVQDVEDAVTLAVDAVKDGVLAGSSFTLVSITTGQVAGEAFHLFSTFAKYFG